MKFEGRNQNKSPELTNIKGTVFQDHARPHTFFTTRTKLLEHDWEVMSHPQCSPDLAPCLKLLSTLVQILTDKDSS